MTKQLDKGIDVEALLSAIPQTPWKDNGLSREEKKRIIEENFKQIMETLGLDLTNDSLIETPKRMAKMYVDEIFAGLKPENFPKITVVKNESGSQMVTEGMITVNSVCEHHLVTICGYAHLAYIPKENVLGLSKFNRIVEYFSSRPQIQERLNDQIAKALIHILGTEDVAVVIDAVHFCVRGRGVKDSSSLTRTASLHGVFKSEQIVRNEFINSIPKLADFKL